jgi:hypothetical protein
MNRKNIIPFILSTLAGGLAALAVCAVFFFYYKPAPVAEKPLEIVEPTPTPEPPKPLEISTEKIKLSDVNSVSVSTVYTGFYDSNSECGKVRNQGLREDSSVSLSYSPCRTVLTFNRNGEATKSLAEKRSDSSAQVPAVKSEWKSKITAEQFETLLKNIAGNKDFIEWQNVLITHSNCTIYAYHKKGMLQLPMYIDIKSGSTLEPLLDAFKELDKKVDWKKV